MPCATKLLRNNVTKVFTKILIPENRCNVLLNLFKKKISGTTAASVQAPALRQTDLLTRLLHTISGSEEARFKVKNRRELTKGHDVVSATVTGLADEGEVRRQTPVVGIASLVLVPVGAADVVRELARAVKHLKFQTGSFAGILINSKMRRGGCMWNPRTRQDGQSLEWQTRF